MNVLLSSTNQHLYNIYVNLIRMSQFFMNLVSTRSAASVSTYPRAGGGPPTRMIERPEGFYWVMRAREPEIAEWLSGVGWALTGDFRIHNDAEFAWIGKRLDPPAIT